MASEWFYNVDGKKNGPHSSAQLQALAKSGALKPTDKVWKEGMAQWVPASKIKGLFPSAGEAVTAKKPQVAASPAANTGKGQPKSRPTPKPKKPKALDDEQESFEQPSSRGKVIGIIAVVAVACVVCLGGAIVAGVLYLNSGTPEKMLAENKEKPKGGQVAVEEKKEPPTEQPKDKTTEKKEKPMGGQVAVEEKKEPPTEQPKDKTTEKKEKPMGGQVAVEEKKEPPTEQPKDKTTEKKEPFPEIPSPQMAFQISSLPRPVLKVSFSSDSKQLVCMRELLYNKGIKTTSTTVTSWDSSSGKEIWTLPPPEDIYSPYKSLAYSPNGLAVSRLSKGISVVDTKTGETIKSYPRYGTPVAFSSDGAKFTCRDFTTKEFKNEPPLVVLEASTGRQMVELKNSGYFEDANGKWYQNHVSTAFNPSGSLLVTCGHIVTSAKQKAGERKIKPLLKVWSASTGEEKLDLSSKAGIGSVNCVTFSPDGKYIASTGSSGILVWNSENGELVNTIKATGEMCCFHPSGKWIAGTSSGNVKLWEPLTSKEVCQMKASFAIYCLSLSGDGNMLAAGGGQFEVSGAMGVWNLFPSKTKASSDSTTPDQVPTDKKLVKGSIELRIKTTLDDALQFNRLLKAQKAYEDKENLIIEVGVDKAKWPPAVIRYAIRASVYDKSGRLLTTVISKEDFTASSAVYNQWQTILGRLKNLPRNLYDQEVGSFTPALLQATDNRLSFPLSAVILREASIVEIGFVTVPRGGKTF